jgi:hypothetical protein
VLKGIRDAEYGAISSERNASAKYPPGMAPQCTVTAAMARWESRDRSLELDHGSFPWSERYPLSSSPKRDKQTAQDVPLKITREVSETLKGMTDGSPGAEEPDRRVSISSNHSRPEVEEVPAK